ncbi:unnamed protein product, partial [Mesorhabditis belari]|uniref:NADP-dependent oxidoreductase domain-containing protein n=1 Tax=Mesorhabditis belari TaxID=2138241 RepID=A0AAF3EUR0_9BILA
MTRKNATLSNGNLMPYIGIGTGGKGCDEATTREMLRIALNAGYRHIDTAAIYGTEHIVGEVLEEFINDGKLKREDFFITTKLAPINHRVEFVKPAMISSLKRLRTDYVDMYLIHVPVSCKNLGSLEVDMADIPKFEFDTEIDLVDTWKEMEKLYKEGHAKAIGVSNFNIRQINRICEHAVVKPMNNQIELHIHFPQKELRHVCHQHGIVVTAFAPIGCPGKKSDPKFNWPSEGPIDDPMVVKLAEKHKKTPAQILLRHLVQHGIVAVPKSTNETRIKQNISIYDFELSLEDMDELDRIATRPRLYPQKHGFGHPEYPFDDVTSK